MKKMCVRLHAHVYISIQKKKKNLLKAFDVRLNRRAFVSIHAAVTGGGSGGRVAAASSPGNSTLITTYDPFYNQRGFSVPGRPLPTVFLPKIEFSVRLDDGLFVPSTRAQDGGEYMYNGENGPKKTKK